MILDRFHLDGRAAIVTGAGRKIGAATAVDLAPRVRVNAVAAGAVATSEHRPGLRQRWLPLTITGISERITEVRCLEILNYSTYAQPTVLFDVMGSTTRQ